MLQVEEKHQPFWGLQCHVLTRWPNVNGTLPKPHQQTQPLCFAAHLAHNQKQKSANTPNFRGLRGNGARDARDARLGTLGTPGTQATPGTPGPGRQTRGRRDTRDARNVRDAGGCQGRRKCQGRRGTPSSGLWPSTVQLPEISSSSRKHPQKEHSPLEIALTEDHPFVHTTEPIARHGGFQAAFHSRSMCSFASSQEVGASLSNAVCSKGLLANN